MKKEGTAKFYQNLRILKAFKEITNQRNYVDLPEDWFVGVADVQGSTKAVEAGLYKTVNIVGAAVISAQINSMNDEIFPFVFGGDGSTFAIPAHHEKNSREQLAAVRRWAMDEFGMNLKAALVPVSEIIGAKQSVSVARFAASPGVDYAMFRGGGVHWAETQMKAGKFEVPIAEEGMIPDLTGLSCRWQSMKSQHGQIVSLVIVPVDLSKTTEFDKFARIFINTVEKLARGGRPVPDEGPGVGWPPEGLGLEAHASHGKRPLYVTKLKLFFETLLIWIMFKINLRLGDFDPIHYQSTSGANSDFRKFEDGLKMTIDCSSGDWDKLLEILNRAEQRGIIKYGSYQQDASMMTCIVPSVMTDDHFHFIDGADGGYTLAAAELKMKLVQSDRHA